MIRRKNSGALSPRIVISCSLLEFEILIAYMNVIFLAGMGKGYNTIFSPLILSVILLKFTNWISPTICLYNSVFNVSKHVYFMLATWASVIIDSVHDRSCKYVINSTSNTACFLPVGRIPFFEDTNYCHCKALSGNCPRWYVMSFNFLSNH